MKIDNAKKGANFAWKFYVMDDSQLGNFLSRNFFQGLILTGQMMCEYGVIQAEIDVI